MSENKFAIILLGAGSSSRMSAPKQLLPWQGAANLIEHACHTCLQSRATCSVFVLGAHADRILSVSPWLKKGFADCWADPSCMDNPRSSVRSSAEFSTVINTNWSLGMSSSLQAGLSELLHNFPQVSSLDSAAVFLADLPLVTSITIDSIAALGSTLPSDELRSSIIVPAWQGHRGHPVFFGCDFWPELMLLSGDRGAGSLLKKYPERCLYWLADSPSICLDCDTPSAYARCCKKENF
ncbi:MAG: NTP transferase domain-containing protein [Candidatus Bruticola sp.]